jgi:hydrogenase expression/formation protein HypC
MGGVNLRVSLMLTPDARVGDYVIVHAGYAIGVMGEMEARETLQLLREIDDANQAADVERSS